MARVVVAMSGGVDSSTVAGLLVEQGHEVIGVHMSLGPSEERAPAKIQSEPSPKISLRTAAQGAPAQGHCCGLDDALDARRVADALGIPFYVVDLRDVFRKAVMDEFAASYLAGRTPNPCVQCNGVLKFRVLLSRALALGADALATGHYARIVGGQLAMARDPDKDQSYFLFPMTRGALEKTLFPLGEMTKPEVRAHAARFGLPVACKPDSQEVCFLPDDDHTRFVKGAAAGLDCSGDIVTEDGRVVGKHDGYFRFTIGQRRGLHLSLGAPTYVLRIEPKERRVVVTTDPSKLGAMGLVASRVSWLIDLEALREQPLTVRVRHRGKLTRAEIAATESGFVARFDEPVRAVAPGQAAVIYAGDRVVGGGYIDRALSESAGELARSSPGEGASP